MNKHAGKQYPHAAPGPAPPLPPGQPPAQQQHQNPYGQTPEQAAAHAAAWAAYYQASSAYLHEFYIDMQGYSRKASLSRHTRHQRRLLSLRRQVRPP